LLDQGTLRILTASAQIDFHISGEQPGSTAGSGEERHAVSVKESAAGGQIPIAGC
jgi:hypothetical protein